MERFKWRLMRLACRLGWHNVSCRGRTDHVHLICGDPQCKLEGDCMGHLTRGEG